MPNTSYAATTATPSVTLDDEKLAKRIAAWMQNQAPTVTNDNQFDTAIDALTEEQFMSLLRRVVKALFKVRPPGSQ